MAVSNKSLPGFFGGVSQQSPVMRLDTQCDIGENIHATIAEGLMQRPNADFVKLLGAISAPTGIKVHKIARDINERYIVLFTTDATNPIKVYDLYGVAQTVRYGRLDADLNFTLDYSVRGYLTSGGITSAPLQIKLVSVVDYTIVVNTQKTCQASASLTPSQTEAAYVWFKNRHDGTYTITLKWESGIFPQTATWEYTSTGLETNTIELADWFRTNAPAAVTNLFDVSQRNNVLGFKVKAGANVVAGSVSIETSDPYGGIDLSPIVNYEVRSLDKLPPHMPETLKLKVHGDKEDAQDDYWFEYDSVKRVYTETVGSGVKYKFDEATLPHRLARTAAGEFTFAPILWEERAVGDNDTAPMPAFVGQKINNTMFHKNRLWFFSKENSIGSVSGDYFNFFPGTVLEVLDSDPIDLAASSEQVTNLRAAKGFDKGMVLIGDEEQFVLTAGDQPFTPKTVSLDNSTAYTADPYCDPVKLGPDVFFVSPKGTYLSLREYTIMPDTMVQDAHNTTSHVPNYIPVGNSQLTGCNLMDMLFLHTSAMPKSLYVYKFLWDGNEKVQQAWYRWTFADTIIGTAVFVSTLYILFYNATTGYRLEKVVLENIPYPGQAFRYYQDSQMKVTGGVYGGVNTVFTLPLSTGDGVGWSVIDAADSSRLTAGFTLSGTTLTITGNASGKTYFVGRDYTTQFRLSEFYPKDNQGRAMIAGNTTLKTLTLSFINTGYFKVVVTPYQRDAVTEEIVEEMTGVKVGESVIGAVTLLSGEETVVIGADSKMTKVDIMSDSYLPFAIQMGAWEVQFNIKGNVI